MIEEREELRARTMTDNSKEMRKFKERIEQEYEFKMNQYKLKYE
jgi:hypothetical protein